MQRLAAPARVSARVAPRLSGTRARGARVPPSPPPAAPAPASPAALRRRASALRVAGGSASWDDSDGAAAAAAAAEAHAPYASASPGELSALLALLRDRRREAGAPQHQPGRVHLVGTGPGDPGLLTLSALHLMQRADVVLYDRLVSPEILELVGAHARLVYVGKAAGFHTRTQEEIHQLLQEFASAGATVVRLKGGDPLVFGRGGEESEYLRRCGIEVAVSPGITAAAGIAAELGIPLTHRGVANSVRFLTGHSREGGEEPAEAVAALGQTADAATTLVLYMGLATLPALSAALLAAGLDPRTPAVAVERGTTVLQRRVFARLGGVAAATRTAGLASPTLVIVGHVVALSPLWPLGNDAGAGAEGGEDAFQLEEGPVANHAEQDHPAWLTLPGGEVLALPRLQRTI